MREGSSPEGPRHPRGGLVERSGVEPGPRFTGDTQILDVTSPLFQTVRFHFAWKGRMRFCRVSGS
jgi:hypothetical protein